MPPRLISTNYYFPVKIAWEWKIEGCIWQLYQARNQPAIRWDTLLSQSIHNTKQQKKIGYGVQVYSPTHTPPCMMVHVQYVRVPRGVELIYDMSQRLLKCARIAQSMKESCLFHWVNYISGEKIHPLSRLQHCDVSCSCVGPADHATAGTAGCSEATSRGCFGHPIWWMECLMAFLNVMTNFTRDF